MRSRKSRPKTKDKLKCCTKCSIRLLKLPKILGLDCRSQAKVVKCRTPKNQKYQILMKSSNNYSQLSRRTKDTVGAGISIDNLKNISPIVSNNSGSWVSKISTKSFWFSVNSKHWISRHSSTKSQRIKIIKYPTGILSKNSFMK